MNSLQASLCAALLFCGVGFVTSGQAAQDSATNSISGGGKLTVVQDSHPNDLPAVFGLRWGMSRAEVSRIADISTRHDWITRTHGYRYIASRLPHRIGGEGETYLYFGWTDQLLRVWMTFEPHYPFRLLRETGGAPGLSTRDALNVYERLKEFAAVDYEIYDSYEPKLRYVRGYGGYQHIDPNILDKESNLRKASFRRGPVEGRVYVDAAQGKHSYVDAWRVLLIMWHAPLNESSYRKRKGF